MIRARTKSEKLIFVGFLDGKEWEVWRVRFNRGSKLNKPVKFFAGRTWSSFDGGCPFSGTHWDFSSEKAAENWFSEQAAEYGGRLERRTLTLVRKLAERGYRDSAPLTQSSL